jgi:hypothetical protein
MPKPADREARALRLAVALQGPRTALAMTGDRTLFDAVRMGDGFFNEFVKVHDHSVNFYVVAFACEAPSLPPPALDAGGDGGEIRDGGAASE